MPHTFIPESSPTIDTTEKDLQRLSAQAWAAVKLKNNPPVLYQLGRELIRIVEDESGSVLPQKLTQDRLRHCLARFARWQKESGGGRPVTFPPKDVVKDMLADPYPPLPKLERIVSHPFFSRDEDLVQHPGYHEHSRVYLSQKLEMPAVPDIPTMDNVRHARECIEDHLLVDFPFSSEADKAHAIALYILPYIRDLIEGPTPVHIIESATPGHGKTLLVNVISSISTGRISEVRTECTQEEEWRRVITSTLSKNPEFFIIDNVKLSFASGALCSAITAAFWEDRLVGKTDVILLPVRCVWVLTGNNPPISTEIARRAIRIRLDAEEEAPWLSGSTRTFKHPNILRWAEQNRGILVWSALVLVQDWIFKGCPDPEGLPVLGMFEEWSRITGGILQNAGIPGFLGNLEEFYDASDQERNDLKAFVDAWWERHGDAEVGTAELYRLIMEQELEFDLGKNTSVRAEKTSLGKALHRLRGRHFGSLVVEASRKVQRAQKYRLRSGES